MPRHRFASLAVAICAGLAAAQTPALSDNLALLPCTGGVTQAYDFPNATFPFLEGKIVVRGLETPPSGDEILVWCISDAPQLGNVMHLWGNSTDYAPQMWSWNATSKLVSSTAAGQIGWCVGAPPLPGVPLLVVLCNSTDSSQLFNYNASSGAFSLASEPGFCVDAGSPPPNCSAPPFSSYTYCNSSAAPADRAADLVSRLTVIDMAYVLEQTNPGIPRLGIPRVQFNEALHGVVYGCGPAFYNATTGYNSTGCPTSFPHGTLLGSTFNRSLWLRVGETISDEGRALHNTINYGIQTWAPDINPARDPRWGRGQEVAGEDAWLLGQYVSLFSRGFQEGEDARFTKILSTAKHWAAYDLENWGNVNRQNFTAVLTPQMTSQYYFVPFQQAAKVVKSFMCSYNAVTVTGTPVVGIPSCANGAFINGVLRDQWGWDGYVVSDCSAIQNVLLTHNYVSTFEAAAEVCMAAGCDVECEFNEGSEVYAHFLPAAVASGNVSLAQVQTAAFRLFREYFALGLLDPPGTSPYQAYGPERVDTAAHRQLALEAAQQGIILLQNNVTGAAPQRPLLPLSAAALKSVALIGPLANATQQLLSIYAGTNTVVDDYSPLAAISRRVANVSYAAGCADVPCTDTTGFGAAVAAAATADAALVFVGLDHTVEDEGRDRVNITLPGAQEALVQAIVATGTPVIVVLIHGGPLAIEWTKANVPAIVSAHYPGELGGEAVAAVLFGDVSPSGRATQTWYPAGFVARPMTDMDLTSGDGLTYLYYAGPAPLWPFGWGLSYTTFSFEWLDDGSEAAVSVATAAREGGVPPFGVKITNTGSVTSDVSALAFVSTGLAGQPLSELFDFQRAAALAPGASTTLFFSLPPSVLATVTPSGATVLEPGRVSIRIGGVPPSSGAESAAAELAANAFAERGLILTGDAVEVSPAPFPIL